MRNLSLIIRSILRQKLNTAIIVVSLTVGFACFNLVILFIERELNTDNFHSNAERIFALKCDDPWIPGAKMYHCRAGSAEYMKQNFSCFEEFCRISNAGVQKIVVNRQDYFDTPYIIAVSENFFRFFSYKLLTNNQATALETDKSLVISDDLARKYFGSGEAIGQPIKFISSGKEEEMIVSGIFEKPSGNTQILFDMVRRGSDKDSRCYVLLKEGSSMQDAEKLMADNHKDIPIIHDGTPGYYYLEPFRQTYFDTSRGMTIEAKRNRNDLWIALVIGLMIIGIASTNYLGLLNNKLILKRKDFIIRRLHGSSRLSLILDFLAENSLIIGISFVLSLFLMQDLLPTFNELTGSMLTNKLFFQPDKFVALLIIAIVLLLATFLFALLRTKAGMDIYELRASRDPKTSRFKLPAFNIFQLTCSIVLIICSIVIVRQMRFIAAKPIGLDKNVIEVKLPGQYSNTASVFKEELLKQPAISQVSITNASPLLEHFLVSLRYKQDGVEKQYVPAGFSGDENYLGTLGIKIAEGEGFSGSLSSNKGKCVVNRSFAKIFQGQDLTGKSMPGMENMTITGIVEDFNYSGLKSVIEPAFISFDNKGSHLMVKSSENRLEEARKSIESVWKKIIPDYPLNIESIGERFSWYHRDTRNYIRLIGGCAFISLLLSMIGLFNVSFQSSRIRTKEIGIRKINGAGTGDILGLLNRDFALWILVSLVLACPAAWYAMYLWLHNYAYKTDISWWIFALAGALTTGIALITVSWQSLRAANRNPVEALRYE